MDRLPLANSYPVISVEDDWLVAICSPQNNPNLPISETKPMAKPKRPLSGYNLFFKNQRQVLLDTLPVRASGKPRKSHGKIGFRQMATIIGNGWRNLDPQTKAYYNALAQEERKRYKIAMRAYKEQQNVLAAQQQLDNIPPSGIASANAEQTAPEIPCLEPHNIDHPFIDVFEDNIDPDMMNHLLHTSLRH